MARQARIRQRWVPVGTALAVAGFSLLSTATPVLAHGVDVTVELSADGVPAGVALVSFTDETGETCIEIIELAGTFAVAIHATGDRSTELISLTMVDSRTEVCELVDVADVALILDDVDAYSLTLVDSGGMDVGTGVLAKPLPPGFESAEPESVRPDLTRLDESRESSLAPIALLVGGPIVIVLVSGFAMRRMSTRRASPAEPS